MSPRDNLFDSIIDKARASRLAIKVVRGPMSASADGLSKPLGAI